MAMAMFPWRQIKLLLARALSWEGTQTFTSAVVTKLLWAAATELTLATDAITVTQTLHLVDTQADAASDDLVTINGGVDGQLLAIRAAHTDRTVVVKSTGNIYNGGADISLTDTSKYVLFVYDGALSKWVVVGGTGGGAALEQVDTFSATGNVTAAQMTGGMGVVTGAYVLSLPTAAVGYRKRFRASTAATYSLDLVTGTDLIILNGTALAAGYKATSDGTINNEMEAYCDIVGKYVVNSHIGLAIDGGA